VIVHNHLFKNAGTTIDWVLEKNFGAKFVDHRDNEEMKGGTAYLERFFRENPQVRALASHHLALPLPGMNGVRFFLLTMYRHPLERVTSVYNFERQQAQADTLGARFAREHSLREYVLWRMLQDVPPTIRNYHVFCCLPGAVQWNRPFTEDDLERAKRFVDATPLVGVVERFDESVALFEHTLRPHFPGISLAYKPQNVRQSRQETTEQRLDRLKAEAGQEAFEALEQGNRLDMKLYAYVEALFQKRLEQAGCAR